jgi:hypothetical protein
MQRRCGERFERSRSRYEAAPINAAAIETRPGRRALVAAASEAPGALGYAASPSGRSKYLPAALAHRGRRDRPGDRDVGRALIRHDAVARLDTDTSGRGSASRRGACARFADVRPLLDSTMVETTREELRWFGEVLGGSRYRRAPGALRGRVEVPFEHSAEPHPRRADVADKEATLPC